MVPESRCTDASGLWGCRQGLASGPLSAIGDTARRGLLPPPHGRVVAGEVHGVLGVEAVVGGRALIVSGPSTHGVLYPVVFLHAASLSTVLPLGLRK